MTVASVPCAEQLPNANAAKMPAIDFVQRLAKKYGSGNRSLIVATV